MTTQLHAKAPQKAYLVHSSSTSTQNDRKPGRSVPPIAPFPLQTAHGPRPTLLSHKMPCILTRISLKLLCSRVHAKHRARMSRLVSLRRIDGTH
jgi:hypothetical protein